MTSLLTVEDYLQLKGFVAPWGIALPPSSTTAGRFSTSRFWIRLLFCAGLCVGGFIPSSRAALTTNSWTNGSGKWETSTNWSLAVAPGANGQSAIAITNAGNHIVTIDTTTAGSFAGTMTISNLLLSAPSNTTNTLFLSSAGSITPLRTLSHIELRSGGALLITNSVLRAETMPGESNRLDGSVTVLADAKLVCTNGSTYVGSPGVGRLSIAGGTYLARDVHLGHDVTGATGTLTLEGGTFSLSQYLAVAGGVGSTASVWLIGGQLLIPSDSLAVGDRGVGQMTVSNGTFVGHDVFVGFSSSSSGTFTIAGGSNSLASFLSIGSVSGVTGMVWMTGGTLKITNDALAIGDWGVGQMVLSNGTVNGRDEYVGYTNTARGTFTMAGGTNIASSFLTIGDGAGVTGTVWMTGGLLVVTNNNTFIGQGGTGELTLSNGAWLARDVHLGLNAGSQGTLLIAGGQTIVSSSLRVGDCALGVSSVATVAGGTLFVTNKSQTAVVEVSSGTFTLNAGSVVADTFVLTNSCAHFVRGGGTFVYSQALLNDGDDTDGDGFSNLAEQEAGTDPLDPGSFPISSQNSWINPGGDLWSVSTNWSAGVAPTNGQSIFITNANSKVVGMDGATPGTTLTISNLTIAAASGETNTLAIADLTAPFVVFDTLNINSGSRVALTNATMRVDGVSSNSFTVDGTMILSEGGALVSTNSSALLGSTGKGELAVSHGTWLAGDVWIAAGPGSQGTLTVVDATNLWQSMSVGNATDATGAVWITRGQSTVTNSSSNIGDSGVGLMTISNGAVNFGPIYLGTSAGGMGMLTVDGGTLTASGTFSAGDSSGGQGSVWLSGGFLAATNLLIGSLGIGEMTLSNGLVEAINETIGGGDGVLSGQGQVVISSGTMSVDSLLLLGQDPCSSTGVLAIAGGNLFITNAAHNAVLEVRSGTLTLSGGALAANIFVMTNACGRFVQGGGTFTYEQAILDPARDDDGDGLPNGWEQAYGLDPLSGLGNDGADADPDGDGQSNLAEYLAGTDPTNSESAFRITSVLPTNDDIAIIWTCGPGKTNALQATAGAADGTYQTNDFTDIFTVTNTVGTLTNYLDPGGATNSPSLYYRVRLVP